jgi:MSHA biogenesis protein MshJ
MNKIKAALAQIQTKFLNLTGREQVVLVIGMVALGYFALDTAAYSNQKQQISLIKAELQLNQAALSLARSSIDSLDQGKYSRVEDDRLLVEREELRKQENTMKAILASVQGKTPQIGVVIRNLIATQHQKIQLVSIKTVTPKQLFSAPIAEPGSNAAPVTKTVYRHGVQLEIKGSYLDLLAYLKSLETSVNGLFWSDLSLVASEAEGNTLRVTIYILSNQEEPLLS